MDSNKKPAARNSTPFRVRRKILFLGLGFCLGFFSFCLLPFAYGQSPATGSTNAPPVETYALPAGVPDPIEPFNRAMWGFNMGVLDDVIKPTSRAYRFVAQTRA